MFKAVRDFRHGGKDFRVGDTFDGSDIGELQRVGLIVKDQSDTPVFHVEQVEKKVSPPKFILKKQKKKAD